MDLVTVIIPCYNQGLYLYDCIMSVVNQTYKNIEIIVVDDGSTDIDTKKVLKELEVYKNIIVIRIKNGGVANARNIAIEISKGKYILPLDADDKIHSEYIESCLKVFNKKKNIDVVHCITRYFGDIDCIFILGKAIKKNMLKQNRVICSAMFRKSDFYECGKYNTNMKYGYEDWDFWLNFVENNKRFYRINKVLFFYRKKHISRSSEVRKKVDLKKAMIEQIFINHEKLFINNNIDLKRLIDVNLESDNKKIEAIKILSQKLINIKFKILLFIKGINYREE